MKTTTLLLRLWLIITPTIVAGCAAPGESNDRQSGEAVVLPEQQKAPPGPPRNNANDPTRGGASGELGSAALEYLLPVWAREDVQPKSARFGQSYGVDAYA